MLGLKGGRSRGSSDMNTMDLKGYQQKANHEKDSEGRRWEPVVILAQVMFMDRTVLEEIYWAMMVILLKGNGC